MQTLSAQVLRYGKEEPLPEKVELRAGPLTLCYEQAGLRYIRLGRREMLRRVYVAVRDRAWGTVPARISNTHLDARDDSFDISFDVEHRQGDVGFAWRGTITGKPDGTIEFAMDGEARSTFLSNRIGFCVLHPIKECAGRPCTVEHVDGTAERGEFPYFISPHQPFTDMRAITHEACEGVLAEVRLEGDVFEMEDQRNWTDESYKIYSTPLRLPAPVEVKKGTRVAQSVRLTLKGRAARPVKAEKLALALTLGDSAMGSLPRLGLCVAGHGEPLNERELARLRKLNLAHLRVDLRPSEPGWESALRRAWPEAEALSAALEAALFLSDAADEELAGLRRLLDELHPAVCTWLVFRKGGRPASAELIELARRHLGEYDPAARIGTGTNADFVALNRSRPPVDALDLVSFSINPQVHAFDNTSMIESLQGQTWTIRSARQFIGNLPLAVGPVRLRRPVSAEAARGDAATGELPPDVDERQMSLFCAAWTAGSLKHICEGGVHSATYYETSGRRGVMELPEGSSGPEKFRSLPGCVFPVYHVLADIGELARGDVIPVASTDPLRVDGLAVRKDGRTCVLVANLTAEEQRVTIRHLPGQVRIRPLDETNALTAMLKPEEFRAHAGELRETAGGCLELDLLPYALARVDFSDSETV